MQKNRILVALSGGVDSSVVALLLKQKGYDIVGVSLNNIFPSDYRNYSFQQGIYDAIKLSKDLQFPYFIVNNQFDFKRTIIDSFASDYRNGLTPNPCILCNEKIKWTKLIQIADDLECSHIATGHYAGIQEEGGEYFITRPKDLHKDQSYFLWRLNQKQLERTLFPLSSLLKDETKEIARSLGYKSIAQKSESFNICFISNNDYRQFLFNALSDNEIADSSGVFTLENGKEIGTYRGVWNFTIGQKKGLPSYKHQDLYVLEIDALNKRIILGEKNKLLKNKAVLYPYRMENHLLNRFGHNLYAQCSYKSEAILCKTEIHDQKLVVYFDSPVWALTPGQSIVFYSENKLVGGGIIENTVL